MKKYIIRAAICTIPVVIGMLIDSSLKWNWATTAGLFLALAIAGLQVGLAKEDISLSRYFVYIVGIKKLLIPGKMTRQHKVALLYGIVGGGFLGASGAAGYSDNQQVWQIVLGGIAGIVVGSYLLLMLVPRNLDTGRTGRGAGGKKSSKK